MAQAKPAISRELRALLDTIMSTQQPVEDLFLRDIFSNEYGEDTRVIKQSREVTYALRSQA